MVKKAGQVKSMKKAVQAVIHTTPMFTHIPAQLASSAPPLGSQLGQRGININAFCKDFNDRTSSMKVGVPIPCMITVKSDRSYELQLNHPPLSHLVMQAAGVVRGAMTAPVEVVGRISRKHVYEIARLKSQDSQLHQVDMKEICEKVARCARLCGIEVVDSLDAGEYGKFLEERRQIAVEQRAQLDAEREAKLLKVKV